MNFTLLSTVITGGETTASTVEQTANAPSPGGMGMVGGISSIVIYIVAIIALFYFMAIRPQKKREKQMQSLQETIRVGDSILLESGMYGKITDITDQCFIVELGMNKGVLIPVLKQRVVSIAEPNLSVTSQNATKQIENTSKK